MSNIVLLMRAFRKVDNADITARDTMLMQFIREEPGAMGRTLAMKLALKTRSNIQSAIPRLIERGFVEDRRVKTNVRTPNNLYLTPAGQAFLDGLVQEHDL